MPVTDVYKRQLLGLPYGKRMDALLDDPLVVRKSFPTFWKVWEPLL